jgi:outer membrane PBP1 activator LpoA protein
MSLTLVKAVFNKALNVNDIGSQKMYAEIWRKLLNVHPMSQKMASQMMSICLHEYQKPRHKNAGVRTMKWIAQICKKKVHKSEDIVHKILSDMFSDNQREEKVELWCKLIEALKSTVNTEKYFPQLKKLKMKFNQRIRFMIMDLEDLKQRKWVPRQ